MTPLFKGIDHLHLYVRDRAAAVDWYRAVLGFEVVEALRFWADDAGGPLTLEDPSGTVHLAVFERATAEPYSVIAFGADGEGFLAWKTHLEQHGLETRCTDHTVSWSLYFQDPEGNMHEISTFDHAVVSAALQP